MVHRDIKPQNIMITQDGRVRILDFGLARLARERESTVPAKEGDSHEQIRRTADTLTLVGSVLGTPDYIAPEQAMDARQADTRSDIYSLGCTCYFLLTGFPPYPSGTAVQKLLAHAESTPSPIAELRSGVPAEVAVITARMMKRQPTERYQTPREVAQAMDDFLKAGPSATVAATHSDHAVDATVNEPRSTFRDPELLKVDLSAISTEDSALLSSVDGPLPAALQEPEEGEPPPVIPPLPPRTTKPPSSKRRKSSRPTQRQSRAAGVPWGIVIPVLLGTVALLGIYAMPSSERQTERSEQRFPEDSSAQAVANSAAAVPQTAVTVSAGEWIDLLQTIDVEEDREHGEWALSNGELSCDGDEKWARISLPVDVPEQYDFEIRFERETGVHSVALIFAMNGQQATLDVDAWGEHWAGIQNVGFQNCKTNGLGTQEDPLVPGEQHTARVRVLRNRVEAYFDDKPLKHYEGDGSNLNLLNDWALPDPNGIGLGAYESAFRFHRVRIRPLTETAPQDQALSRNEIS